jgi:murein DD-endopeptidase MepM/ murein hydrolase activator NlpD
MANRRWTLMIVPDGTGSPRSIAISERALRMVASVATAVGLLFLIGLGILIAQFGSPTALLAARQNRQLSQELEDLRARLVLLQDTIGVIGRRDEQIRLLAGLPSVDSTVREAGIGGPGTPDLSTEPLYRSNRMLGRLAFGARSDIDGLIRRANVLSASFAEITDSLSNHVERLAATPSIMPTAGWLSSHFTRNRLHPILHISRPHEGIDVSAPMGAPIIAPAAGRVVRVGQERGYGNILEIDHGNGILTKFAHCSRIMVRPGQRVTRGQVVAAVGNTGLSTGPHLHYEIHVNGRVVDPLKYVLPDGAIPD